MPNTNIFLKAYQHLIISGAILLFCVIGLAAAVLPASQKILTLVEDTRKLSDEETALQTKLNALNNLDEGSLRQELSDVISAVPSDKSLPTVFSTVDGVAVQADVSVVSESIGGNTPLATGSASNQTAQEKQLGTRTIPFSVTIQGTLDAVQHFIALAPQVRRLLRIRTFAITFPAEDRPISIALEMDAFYQPSPTTLGATGTVLTTVTDSEQATINQVTQLPVATGSDLALPPPLIGQMKPNPFAP